MNVKTLCLAILYDENATGYEIRKLSVEGEYAYFVEASFGSIYPALAKLEEEELVTSQVELQDGKPAKKVYSITEAGRTAFHDSLFEELGDDVYRSEFLLFARFAPMLPASLVETRLNERLEILDNKLSGLNKLLQKSNTPHDTWVIQYGMTCMKVARNYIATHMHELIALARPENRAAEAAE
ncbi:PadR family transcriptional regulator [Mariluticola halotolerans]|uniref:PadR family transcriptional regulator n=1 Tax=Mariluticola halotolerans TaxID=2909283 RepID=UPI0026E33B13|nr:PadR family transcriptional regulator [Mariluticola halotolerans]UJQ94812.1 PadR family transcriptional regulator [Mariluticola halotolerans]